MRRFICVFISLLLVLFLIPVPRASAAEDDIFNGDVVSFGVFVSREQQVIDWFETYIGSVDDYFFIVLGNPRFDLNLDQMSIYYISKSDFSSDYVVSDNGNYILHLRYFNSIQVNQSGYENVSSAHRISFSYSNFSISQIKAYQSAGETFTFLGQNLISNIDFTFGGKLRFEINPDFTLDMSLNNLAETFTLDAINDTDNYYNYMMYISSHPASIGIQRSLSDATYIMASTQWCMKYAWNSTAMDESDLYDSVKDYVTDLFGTNILDMWGNALDIGKSYWNSQGDGFNYYQLSQQDNCPFYLIKPKDSKSHIIPYSAMNLELNKDYYVNIIYLDTTDYGVAPASSSPADFDIHNSYRDHPIYNLNLISSYVCYCALNFNFIDGAFDFNADNLSYDKIVQNSNPNASSATISSDDNSVDINSNTSYDNSSSVSYINYGTIYHNCQWGSSGSGTSSGAVPVPDLPAFEFEELLEGSAAFLSFVKIVLFESMPEIFTVMLVAAFAVVIYCRVWGR